MSRLLHWRSARIFGLVVAGAAACGVVAACGTAASSSATSTSSVRSAVPTASPAPCAGAAACVTLTTSISGDVTASETQVQARGSCADLLAVDKVSGAGQLTLPRPVQSLAGHQVMIYPSIYPWTGPGTYTTHKVTLVSEDGFITVDGVRYAPSAWQGTATVAADGSGSMTFSGMVRDGDPQRTLSGQLNWKCGPG